MEYLIQKETLDAIGNAVREATGKNELIPVANLATEISQASGLSFRILGGTSQPTSAKENDIWVNTSTAIHAWDFSATEPMRRSKNKNLFVYPYLDKSKASNGITYTVNSDGSISASGTATSSSFFTVASAAMLFGLDAGTYTLSGCPDIGGEGKCKLCLRYADQSKNDIVDSGKGKTFTITEYTLFEILIAIYPAAGNVSIVYKPQLEKGSSATSFVKGDASGQVWVETGASSSVEFNALKKNDLRVYPVSARQYVGGVWEKVAAKSYQNSAWKDWWAGQLYDHGEEYPDITGDLVAYALDFFGDTNKAPTITKNSDSIVITTQATNYSGGLAYWAKRIDLSSYSTLKVNGLCTDTSRTKIVVLSEIKESAIVASGVPKTVEDDVEIDISGLSGEYYIGFAVSRGSGSNQSMTIKMVDLD